MRVSPRVLLVDDEPVLLRSMQRLFRATRPEWSLRTAASAADAVLLLEEEATDVLVTDLDLGETDGTDLLGFVMDRWPGTIRIAFTGHASGPQVIRAASVIHQVVHKAGDPETLLDAIERALTSRASIVDETMRGWISGGHELPAAPSLWPRLEEALRRPKTTSEELAALIEQDPAVTARVLQLASSAYFGASSPPRSVAQAANWIGVANLRGLVLSVELARLFRNVPPALNVDQIAFDGYRTGRLAMAILRGHPDAARALLGGILHDLGILVRGMRGLEALLADFRTADAMGLSLHTVERKTRGFTHAEVGAALLGVWGIEEALVDIVRDHHVLPPIGGQPLDGATAVYLANLLVAEADEGLENPRIDVDASWLGVTAELPAWRELAQANAG